MTESNTDAGRRSGPNPALRSPDWLVGTWEKPDPSEAGTADGRSTLGWMEGVHFLLQRVNFTVSIAMPRAKGRFVGKLSEDGNSLAWRR